MSKSSDQRERRRLLEVVREYKLKGYEVTINPNSEQLPPFIASFNPDAIATSENDNVVIEVSSNSSKKEVGSLAPLAEVVEREPNWRFELVVTNSAQPSLPPSLSSNEIKASIHSARNLFQLGREKSTEEKSALIKAALVTAWAALEALLRSWIGEEMMSQAKNLSPIAFVKTGFSDGIISASEYDILLAVANARNKVVHGFVSPDNLENLIEEFLEICGQLISRWETRQYSEE